MNDMIWPDDWDQKSKWHLHREKIIKSDIHGKWFLNLFSQKQLTLWILNLLILEWFSFKNFWIFLLASIFLISWIAMLFLSMWMNVCCQTHGDNDLKIYQSQLQKGKKSCQNVNRKLPNFQNTKSVCLKNWDQTTQFKFNHIFYSAYCDSRSF